MDGNTFAAILAILFTAIMGNYAFTFMVYRKIERESRDTNKWMSNFASGLQRFELKQQANYYELKASIDPIVEAFHTARKVKESRTMEAFLEGTNPWTAHEVELKIKFYNTPDSLREDELLELIEAFDRHLNNHEFGRVDSVKAIQVLECLNSRLQELKARERIYQETPHALRVIRE